MALFDSLAVGSDAPRSLPQYLARRAATLVVAALRLNSGGFLSTEIAQMIRPIHSIPTRFGALKCVGGHGRLRWRAHTFFEEDPQTIQWLDGIGKDDVLWDIGSNVGLYAIYAARNAGCHVLAFEPEAQNYALLIENLVLNDVGHLVSATNMPVCDRFDLGRLHVNALTKGGAYNQFQVEAPTTGTDTGITQVQMGVTMDDLVGRFGFAAPTHVKIDVDGNERDIVKGGATVLRDTRCQTVNIEVDLKPEIRDPIHAMLTDYGFRHVSESFNQSSPRETQTAINEIWAR